MCVCVCGALSMLSDDLADEPARSDGSRQLRSVCGCVCVCGRGGCVRWGVRGWAWMGRCGVCVCVSVCVCVCVCVCVELS